MYRYLSLAAALALTLSQAASSRAETPACQIRDKEQVKQVEATTVTVALQSVAERGFHCCSSHCGSCCHSCYHCGSYCHGCYYRPWCHNYCRPWCHPCCRGHR
jgi:hypothetical protein